MRVLMFTVNPSRPEQNLKGKEKELTLFVTPPETVTVVPLEAEDSPEHEKRPSRGRRPKR